MSKYIYLIAGASGAGKSTVTRILQSVHGWTNLNSYTTRKPRYNGEGGHIFVSKEEFDAVGEKAGYTIFDGQEYGATAEQVAAADMYIIDPKGAQYFAQHYQGDKIPILVYLTLPEENAIENMRKRGDSYAEIKQRALHDRDAFANMDTQLKYYGMEYMIYESNDVTPPRVIAQLIYDDRKWREGNEKA